MRVALVSEHASPLATLGGVDAGGQNVHVAALAAELGRRGLEVTVYTRRDDASLPAQVPLAPGVVVEHVPAGPARPVPKDDLWPHMPEFADHLWRTWQTEPPDLVHAHFWMSGQAALDAARPLHVPVVQTFHALGVVKRRHQGDRDTSPRVRLGVEERLARSVDRIIATCSDEVFELLRIGADLRRMSVVPCGVDVEHFRPDGPAEPRRAWSHRVLFVGRLVERKGVGNTITALAEVPDTELVVAGGPSAAELDSDPETRRLRNLAASLGVSDRVQLRGRVGRAELPSLVRSADVVVCAPWYEPFGIVALEGMACGIPVVATAVGGLVDTVLHAVTGLHVPPRQPPELAAALRRLLADPALRHTLGENGVRRARARYSWDRVADATWEIYQEVVAPRQEDRTTRARS